MNKYNLSWCVYRQDWNSGKIEQWNIFEHGSFAKDTKDLLTRKIDKDTFADAVKSNLMYYFWSKSEYEIILKNWLGKDYEIKIDVYDQVMLNFDKFIDYLWGVKIAEYINRKDVREMMRMEFDDNYADEAVDRLLDADVAPVRRGAWEGTADGYADGELVYDMWNCSECGFDADGAEEKPNWKFCPNCGARCDSEE